LRSGFFSSRFPLAFCSAIIALSASIDDDEVEAVFCLFDELDMMETGPRLVANSILRQLAPVHDLCQVLESRFTFPLKIF
jgi:hypothetical protein